MFSEKAKKILDSAVSRPLTYHGPVRIPICYKSRDGGSHIMGPLLYGLYQPSEMQRWYQLC